MALALQFVARNGPAFEQKILSNNEKATTTFSFLLPSDPWHKYYLERVERAKGPATPHPEDHVLPKVEAAPPKTVETKEAEPVKLVKPDPDEWALDIPSLSPLDLYVC